jgi:hypothetical protein
MRDLLQKAKIGLQDPMNLTGMMVNIPSPLLIFFMGKRVS